MSAPVTAEQIMRQRRGEPASQATSIEQSRAVAEVQAAVTVAQARPRNESIALNRVLESCRTIEVAESAFYKFKRGNETVSDASIRLAEELARCWGNIDYGIMELDRNDDRQMSEMLAFAWDLETNTKSRMTFLVPHRRDTRQGPKALTDMRDIYENNANNGARRLRECIFRVLPPYLKEQAKQECYETLRKGTGDKPLNVRIAGAIESFQGRGISLERLEAKLGKSSSWTDLDVANLQVSYRSIVRQEISADEEFPRIGADDVAREAQQIIEQRKSTNPPVTDYPPVSHNEQSQGDAGEDKKKPSQKGKVASQPIDPAGADINQLTNDLMRRISDVTEIADLEACESDMAQIRQRLTREQETQLDAALDSAEVRLAGGSR